MAAPPDAPGARAQRVLATMAATVIGLTVIAIVVLLITALAGVPPKAFASGPLLFVRVFPLPGLVIGLLLAIALIIVSGINRARAQRPPR